MKFDTKTNLNMQDLMVVFILSVFRPEYPFWGTLFGKFGPKKENCLFELKIGTQTDSNMMDSMMMFIIPVFKRKYHFFWNIVP